MYIVNKIHICKVMSSWPLRNSGDTLYIHKCVTTLAFQPFTESTYVSPNLCTYVYCISQSSYLMYNIRTYFIQCTLKFSFYHCPKWQTAHKQCLCIYVPFTCTNITLLTFIFLYVNLAQILLSCKGIY